MSLDLRGKRAVLTQPVREEPRFPGLSPAGVAVQVIPLVPQGGAQLIAAGATFSFNVPGPFKAVRLFVDVPENVIFHLYLDNSTSPFISSQDLKGLIGGFDLGDFTGNAYSHVARAYITGQNVDAVALDVRAWLVVLAA